MSLRRMFHSHKWRRVPLAMGKEYSYRQIMMISAEGFTCACGAKGREKRLSMHRYKVVRCG